jgi:mono/diheme cytochrome c family protein
MLSTLSDRFFDAFFVNFHMVSTRIFLLFLCVALAACNVQKMETMSVETPSVKQGFELYGKYCHQCHGLAATGSPLARFQLSEREIVKDQNLFLSLVLKGREGTYMKGFEKRLNQKHIEAIRLYLLSLNKE